MSTNDEQEERICDVAVVSDRIITNDIAILRSRVHNAADEEHPRALHAFCLGGQASRFGQGPTRCTNTARTSAAKPRASAKDPALPAVVTLRSTTMNSASKPLHAMLTRPSFDSVARTLQRAAHADALHGQAAANKVPYTMPTHLMCLR